MSTAYGGLMNLAGIVPSSHVVGPGCRDAIYFQGCSIRCPGCANMDFLDPAPRRLVQVARVVDSIARRRGRIDGVSVLGGEPTDQPEALAALLEGLKGLGLSTVLFSGRTHEHLAGRTKYRSALRNTDLLIDGPFVLAEQDLTLHWRGSRNQRLVRLSSAFSDRDLESDGPNGEVIVSQRGVVLHGIGSYAELKRGTFARIPVEP